MLESQTSDDDISSTIAIDVHYLNKISAIQNGSSGARSRDRHGEVFTGIVSQSGTDIISPGCDIYCVGFTICLGRCQRGLKFCRGRNIECFSKGNTRKYYE